MMGVARSFFVAAALCPGLKAFGAFGAEQAVSPGGSASHQCCNAAAVWQHCPGYCRWMAGTGMCDGWLKIFEQIVELRNVQPAVFGEPVQRVRFRLKVFAVLIDDSRYFSIR